MKKYNINIVDILMCPECKSSLTNTLECRKCNSKYTLENGIYNIVSKKLSADQAILWKISDEEIYGNCSNTINSSNDYQSRKNAGTLKAEEKHQEYIEKVVPGISGIVCDLATGLGNMLNNLVNYGNKNMEIICTDIDKRVLMLTKKRLNLVENSVSFVATDGRYLSIKNDSFDFITSRAVFGNIPETEKIASEMYRVLQPKGKIIVIGTFIEKDSKSFKLAESIGIGQGMVEEYLIGVLADTKFHEINSTIVAKAEWAENPYDLIPVAGDMQYYYVLEAEK